MYIYNCRFIPPYHEIILWTFNQMCNYWNSFKVTGWSGIFSQIFFNFLYHWITILIFSLDIYIIYIPYIGFHFLSREYFMCYILLYTIKVGFHQRWCHGFKVSYIIKNWYNFPLNEKSIIERKKNIFTYVYIHEIKFIKAENNIVMKIKNIMINLTFIKWILSAVN